MFTGDCKEGCNRPGPTELNWNKVVHEYGPIAIRYAFSLTGNQQDAEDCVQEALIRLFRASKKYDPTKKLLPYLMTIVRNTVYSNYRPEDKQLLPIDLFDEILGTSVVEDTILQELVLERAVEKIVEETGLTPDQATIFVYATVDGLKPSEIACLIGKTPAQTRKRLSRMRKKICKKINRNDVSRMS